MLPIPTASILRKLGFLAAVCTIAACAAQRDSSPTTGAPAAAAAAKEALTLKFDWPDGLRARVRTTAVKSQSIGSQSRLQDLVSSYTMNVRYGAEEISVAFEDFQVERAAEQTGSNPTLDRILAYRPGFTVDKTGELLKVIGLETLRELLGPFRQQIAAAPEEQRPGLEAVAQTIASEQYLKARAGAEWGNLIGNWLGQTLTPDQPKVTIAESEPTGFVETPLRTSIKVSMTRIGPCQRGEPRQCVRLWMTREPDQEALRDAMLPNLGKLLGVDDWGPEGMPELRSVIATSKLILDAELETLVPHRVETLRIFSLEMVRPDGTLEVRDSNRSTSTYEY